LIVSGTGKIRAGNITRKLVSGDCVLNPPGEAHQLINTGKTDLLYYVIANNSAADFYHYPDSNKWGMWAPHLPDAPNFRQQAVNYNEGEESSDPRKPHR